MQPHAVALTFMTSPAGLKLVLDGTTTVTSPATVTSWEAWRLTAAAPTQQDASGGTWVFGSWSDGGAASHAIATPATATTYTATFVASTTAIHVNFQPAGSPVPAGYVADTGLVFGARSNGLAYGWNAANDLNTRDRNSVASADQRYDTLDHRTRCINPVFPNCGADGSLSA